MLPQIKKGLLHEIKKLYTTETVSGFVEVEEFYEELELDRFRVYLHDYSCSLSNLININELFGMLQGFCNRRTLEFEVLNSKNVSGSTRVIHVFRSNYRIKVVLYLSDGVYVK